MASSVGMVREDGTEVRSVSVGARTYLPESTSLHEVVLLRLSDLRRAKTSPDIVVFEGLCSSSPESFWLGKLARCPSHLAIFTDLGIIGGTPSVSRYPPRPARPIEKNRKSRTRDACHLVGSLLRCTIEGGGNDAAVSASDLPDCTMLLGKWVRVRHTESRRFALCDVCWLGVRWNLLRCTNRICAMSSVEAAWNGYQGIYPYLFAQRLEADAIG